MGTNEYVFHGLVLPEWAELNIPPCRSTFPEEKIEIILSCINSKLVAKCSCSYPNADLLTLKRHVEFTARTIVDVVGFMSIAGYDVEIEKVYNPEKNQQYFFGIQEFIFDDDNIDGLARQPRPHPALPISCQELAKLSAMNTELSIALADFREAIRQTNFTSFHCYRAIEALKSVFDRNKKSQWEKFRITLNIKRDDIERIKNSADILRHGELTLQTWEIRKEHLLITWSIINKYIDWRSKNPK